VISVKNKVKLIVIIYNVKYVNIFLYVFIVINKKKNNNKKKLNLKINTQLTKINKIFLSKNQSHLKKINKLAYQN
jgi:hypothetical protein